jgi:hypothetical protein
MKASRAVWIVVLLPLITVPWLYSSGPTAAWWGLPVWTVYSLAMTAVLAALIAGWTSRWWDALADEAEALSDAPAIQDLEADEKQ